jgi:hypothetical protein
MKTKLALLASAFIAISSAQSAIIFQTQNFSNVTTGTSLTWNQFDSSLGTLTGVVFDFGGTLSGSFDITDTDSFSDVTVSSPNARLGLSFSGGGAPSPLQGTSATFATSPASGFTVSGGATQTFTVDPSPFTLTPYTSSNLIASAAYFTGLSTFNTSILRIMGVTLVGGTSSQDFSNALADGSVGLIYTYTPTSAIPEPGTWAAAALLAGGAAFVRWRKRKLA